MLLSPQLRSALLAAAGSPTCRSLVENTGALRPIVDRFVAAPDVDGAVRVAAELATDRLVSLDHLGEDTTDRDRADATVDAYRELLTRLGGAGLADRAEVSVKLSALGRALPVDGEKIALDNARRVCAAAAEVGTAVTVDMEDHTTTDVTLAIVRDLRVDFPETGAVVQAYLRRTEADCADLAGPGSRVRLCKGAYAEPRSVAFTEKADVDASYVRCLRVLMAGEGYPMVATHDHRLVEIAEHLALRAGRTNASYELQMLYGVRPRLQEALAARGLRMRVYVPYGGEWYPYFTRRLAERPANLAFFARSLVGRT
ncbi:proline dehydrogenase [Amycolatopsis arida]|uniref:proline dehydrogenase n=1 Tax=Amycolatopsis arida TaxID=587909 RepID=A0A1I5SN53_9PSEU|nr:proline dehydrogenase family protein [Amycolatopsis arida]TDX96423.1 proline dehydrogenase [Amycolatopsis arida]SFP71947.1 proline dehydrogenase [Amycolatopsis arida]